MTSFLSLIIHRSAATYYMANPYLSGGRRWRLVRLGRTPTSPGFLLWGGRYGAAPDSDDESSELLVPDVVSELTGVFTSSSWSPSESSDDVPGNNGRWRNGKRWFLWIVFKPPFPSSRRILKTGVEPSGCSTTRYGCSHHTSANLWGPFNP